MKNYAIIFACVSILCSIFGCDSAAKEEATVLKITNDSIQLSDGTTIDFPKAEEKKSVLFITPPGEYDKATKGIAQGLTPKGAAYAQKVKELLKEIQLNSVLAIGTAYAQDTGRPLADSKKLKVYTFNNVDYGSFLDYVYTIEVGSKFLVVDHPTKIPELLYTLTAGEKFDLMPDSIFNELYVVFSSQRGKAEVHKLKF